MGRWIPAIVKTVFFAVALGIALLPVHTKEDESCHASALSIVRGKHVPEEIKDECHEEARKEMWIAALPFSAGVLALFLTGPVMKPDRVRAGTPAEEDVRSEG